MASEFAVRGYDVALTMTERGSDLVVLDRESSRIWRIQVQTSLEKDTQPNYFQFSLTESEIHRPTASASHFAFVLRLETDWKFFIVPQGDLARLVSKRAMGSLSPRSAHRVLTFIHVPAANEYTCSGIDMCPFMSAHAWRTWPAL